MSEFSDRVKAHLARYKREHLGIAEHGLWRSNQTPYPHILPEAVLRLNILETIHDEFWAYYEAHRSSLVLHTDFHHLNSSQAFAFNLLFPWIDTNATRGYLLSALGLSGEEIVRWSFEHIPDPAERTTFDFHLELASSRRVLVEVKLTEPHFGNVVPKPEHRIKLEKTYMPRLAGKARPESLDEANFFLNYQLFRNVSHLDINRGDLLVLLLPRANAFTWLQGEAFRSHLEPSASDCVRLVAVEDLYEVLTKHAENISPRLCTHMDLLRAKYSFGASP
jgi:hypothetical protein